MRRKKIYYVGEFIKNEQLATKKAPADIVKKIIQMGGESLYEHGNLKGIKGKIACYTRMAKKIRKNDIVIFQYPYIGAHFFSKAILLKLLGAKLVCVLHDINSLRSEILPEELSISKSTEINILSQFDFVICHNDKMVQTLSKLIHKERLISLLIFDYLCDPPIPKETAAKNEVSYAGNLIPKKAGFIYQLLNSDTALSDIKLHLYGPYFEGKKARNADRVEYHGVENADMLPSVLAGSWGLVWDGNQTSSCGEYYKIICPHKCSLYLAAGVPVIIWREAALGEFVEKHGVGITIGALSEINTRLAEISDEEYFAMKANAEMIGKKIRLGMYFQMALESVYNKIG